MSPTSLERSRLGTLAVVSPVAMRRMAPTRVVTGRAIRNTRMYQVTARAARPLAKAAADHADSLRWIDFNSAQFAAECSTKDRKSVVLGKSVLVRVGVGGCSNINKKTYKIKT